MQEPQESRNTQTIVRLSSAVWAASAKDRANRKFSELVDRLLRNYYLNESSDDIIDLQRRLAEIDRLKSPMEAEAESLRGRIAALQAERAQKDSEGNEGWTFASYCRYRLILNPRLERRLLLEGASDKGYGEGLSQDIRNEILQSERELLKNLSHNDIQRLRDAWEERKFEDLLAEGAFDRSVFA
jgi:hypothetical protein